MKKIFFYFLFFLFKIIITKDTFEDLKQNENSTIEYFIDNVLISNIALYLELNDSSFLNNLSISEKCKIQLNDSFFNKDNYTQSFNKLIIDSPLSNNIYSYYNCINNKDFAYLIILINGDKTIYDVLNTKNINSSSYLVGVCFLNLENCTNEEYGIILNGIIKYYNNKLNTSNNSNTNNDTIYDNIINNNIININIIDNNTINNDTINNDTINNYTINNDTKDDDSNEINMKIYKINDNNNYNFWEYLPFIIILIHLFFVIFNTLPLYLYNLCLCICCCKKENRIPIRTNKLSNYSIKKKQKNNILTNQTSDLVDSYRNPSISSLLPNADNFQNSVYFLYNINKNFSSIAIYKKQSGITNDSGLSYINGIKAISMIFFFFGAVYNCLYDSFLVEKDKNIFFHHLKNFFFSLFYVGIKYAPKLLLCTSGFSLFFKFICFLDGKVENEEEIIRQNADSTATEKNIKEIKNINPNNESNSNTNSFYKQLKQSASQEIISKNYLVSFRYLLYFYGMQFHKYLIFILFLTFIIFSLNKIVLFFENPMSVWSFFNEKMINSVKKVQFLLLPLLIGFKSHLFDKISNKNENILDYLYLVFQEIIYFLFTTLIIFIGYKRNLRIDRFFKLIFIILFIFRIVFYCQKKLDDKNYFGYINDYGKFYTSILYNYTFYIIGLHFGMINYIIQKGYSFRECSRQNKLYLIHSLRILKTTKRRSKKYLYIMSIICGVILLFNTFLQQIIMLFYKPDKDNTLKNYKKDVFTQILMFIDADIFVFAFNLMALCLYIKGDNIINNILCHNFWCIFNRFYFSFILLINPIILYVIYVNETKIIFNFSSCFLYCFICGILVFSISIFVCVAFELPYKKLIHFWIKLSEKAVMKERMSNIEATYSYGQNLLDSATASITDFLEEEEEDEEN